jgi:NADPH2:quinone reductase
VLEINMKAIRIHETGGPEVLKYEDVDLPPPPPGAARVKHAATGVNFIDIYHRTGLYKMPLPAILGSEAAGVVEALGDGVTELKTGDRVAYAMTPGAYAEANNVPADRLVKIPAGVSDETAAAVLLKGMTAQYLVKRTYDVKSGETVLVHAAAGATGSLVAQWAKHLGATVIGTVGSDDKIGQAKENGCAHVLNLSTEDWVKRLRDITGGKGVPVVYDGIGKATWDGSLDSLGVRGLMVSFGNASGAVPPFSPAVLSAKGSLYLTRPGLASYTRSAEELQETAQDLFAVIASGAVKIKINQRFKLAEAAKAHEALHSRKTVGATVLLP